jgi:hypothetical protein
MTLSRAVYWMVFSVSLFVACDAGQCGTRNYDVGDRLSAVQLRSTDGKTQLVNFERPTIAILWASWSPNSLTALREVLKAAPQGGIRWQILPINVDSPRTAPNDTSTIHASARTAGLNGPVLYDSDYQLMDQWEVLSIPTIIFTGLGGEIDEIEHDWSPVLRDRLFTLYFGAITDSFPGITIPRASPRCISDVETARRLWRIGRAIGARAIMQRVADSCIGLPADLARYANWIYSMGDSVKMRDQVWRMMNGPEQNAWTTCARAGMASRRGQHDSAAALCQEAVSQDSAFYPAWILLAESKWIAGDTAAAVMAHARARGLNRHDARVSCLGAQIATGRMETQEAAELMRQAVESRLRRRTQ